MAFRGRAGDRALQDVLNLGKDAQMNQPGEAEGNWRWRCTRAMLNPTALEWLRKLTLASNGARVLSHGGYARRT